ncbi:MAG TPA: hypothetical protein VF021_02110 [Longimicrobiales bacterium]
MSDRQQDSELRARFDAQRHAEASEAPPFEAMLARARAQAADAVIESAPRRLRLRRVLYAGGLAVAAAIGALLVLPRSHSSEDAFEQAVQSFQSNPAMGAWRSPTDGLLDVPGSQLMSTVPSVGAQ